MTVAVILAETQGFEFVQNIRQLCLFFVLSGMPNRRLKLYRLKFIGFLIGHP